MKLDVHTRFGIYPSSIPDYLALVGDTADGFLDWTAGAKRRPQPYWGIRSL